MAEFRKLDLAGDYFDGQNMRLAQERARQGNALGANQVRQSNALAALSQDPNATPDQYARIGETGVANSLNQSAQLTAEQKQRHAKQIVTAAQYALQSPDPKAFIEQNFPELAQSAGASWQASTPEQVKAKLNEAIGIFGPVAGIGPQEPPGVSGALYKYVDQNGRPVYGDAKSAVGKTPYRESAPERAPAPPSGYRANPDGTLSPIKGGPADQSAGGGAPPAKLTEADKKVRVLLSSMENAEKDIASLKNVDTSSIGQAMLGSNRLTAPMQSDAFRKYEAAGLRWAANLLYIKSGATATPDEIRSTWKQFFPQPGEGEDVKAQKAASRQQEITAIKGSYGDVPATTTAPAATSGWSIKAL